MINNRSEHVAPAKGAERLVDVSKELAELGSIKEGLVSEIARLQKLAEDYKGIDEKVVIKEKELQELNISVKDLANIKSEFEKISEDLAYAKKELSEANTLTQGILKGNAELWETKKKIDDKIKEKESELQSVITNNKNKLSKSKDEFADFENRAIKKVDEYDSKLQELEKKQNSYIAQIEDLKKGLTEITTELVAKTLELEMSVLQIENNKTTSKEIIDSATLKAEKIIEEAVSVAKKTSDEMVSKQGELSEKTSWLLEKEKTLRETKLELERFYGRKINNVII